MPFLGMLLILLKSRHDGEKFGKLSQPTETGLERESVALTLSRTTDRGPT